MKFIKFASLAVVVVAICYGTTVSAKTKIVPKVYVFGFAASFNDSVVYFTDVQEVDSAFIDSKNKFLLSRDNYSYQLRDYLETLNMQNRTCVTMFDFKRKKVEKEYYKLKHKYIGKNKYDVRFINQKDFHYQRIDLNVEEEDSTMLANEKKMKENRKLKANMARGKRPQEGGKGAPEGMPGDGSAPGGHEE